MSVRAIKWAIGLGHVDLTPVQRNVLFVLAYHHNHTNGLCCPSVETIGAEIGLKERAAREAISGLVHVGLVRREKRTNERGQATNQYILFGKVKNKSGRHLRAPTGRHHTTATPGRHHGAGEREDNITRAGTEPELRVVNGGRHE